MLGVILATVAALFSFLYLTIIYLPILYFKDEDTTVHIAREKVKWICKNILGILGTKVEVIYKNKEALEKIDKKIGIVYVANHQSNFDIPVITSSLITDVGYVAKEEMKNWPFFNIWMKKSKCVFLNRTNPREGIKSIKASIEIIKSGYPIVIFPEGERSFDAKVLPFKKGSFKLATETNGVIIPVTLVGTIDIQKRGSIKIKRNQKVKIIIDEPIFVSNLDREELKNLNTKVREIIIKNLQDS